MRLRSLFTVAWLLPWALAAEPKVSTKQFEHQPRNLMFFDDSEVAIIVEKETGVVWRTKDAGGEWEATKEIGEGQAVAVFKHPYDNKVAVTLGRRTQHWITKDQGATWKSFKTEEPPSGFSPISFHATDPDRILYNGEEECGFFSCIGKVS